MRFPGSAAEKGSVQPVLVAWHFTKLTMWAFNFLIKFVFYFGFKLTLFKFLILIHFHVCFFFLALSDTAPLESNFGRKLLHWRAEKNLINLLIFLCHKAMKISTVCPLMMWRLPGKPGWISCRVSAPCYGPSIITQSFMESQELQELGISGTTGLTKDRHCPGLRDLFLAMAFLLLSLSNKREN